MEKDIYQIVSDNILNSIGLNNVNDIEHISLELFERLIRLRQISTCPSIAIDALNRLLTAPLPPNFGDSDKEESDGDFGGGSSGGGGTTTGMGGGDEGGADDDAGMEPDEDEPADTEPESDMI